LFKSNNVFQLLTTNPPPIDRKETFSVRYNPKNDPTISDPEALLKDERYSYGGDDLKWDGTSHLPGFRETTIEFYQRRLALARKMVRIFALALEMPEDYFDNVTTHPGADGLYVHYPGTEDIPEDDEADVDVGIGSHTDIQCLTLLWQDMSGGLQVLSASDEWLDARPIAGTLVVNIGDFLQRLSNKRFKSTVHRVYNRQKKSRYSMPFFLGFNPDSVCTVVPSCVDEAHPALYEPISCGKVRSFLLCLALHILTSGFSGIVIGLSFHLAGRSVHRCTIVIREFRFDAVLHLNSYIDYKEEEKSLNKVSETHPTPPTQKQAWNL
jgi:hypothetical protein